MSYPFNFQFELKHSSPNLDCSSLGIQDASLSIFFGTPWFAEFREKYGWLVLVLQDLEVELQTTVDYMKKAYEKALIEEHFEVEPKEASFEVLIRMFSSQLVPTRGSRDLISQLHRIRKYRNRLAHQFLDYESVEYHLSAGGREKTIHNLKQRIEHVIALVMLIHRIGRAYATDIGITDDVLDRALAFKNKQLGINDDGHFLEYTLGLNPFEPEPDEDKGDSMDDS